MIFFNQENPFSYYVMQKNAENSNFHQIFNVLNPYKKGIDSNH